MFVNDEHIKHLKTILKEVEKRYFLIPETIGIDEDHVHILMQAAPRYSPSKVMQIVKSITAREMFKRFPDLKDDLWGGEFWSDGGCIKTIGEGNNGDIVRDYIRKQGRKEDQLNLFDFAEP